MKKPIVLILLGIFAIGTTVWFVLPREKIYCADYYSELGIRDRLRLGNMEKTEQEAIEIRSENGIIYVTYDVCTIVYHEETKHYMRVEVENEKVRFGKKKIGVGSTRADALDAYKGIAPLVDLPANQEGFMDGGLYVSYIFDQENNVRKIILSIGP